MNKKEVNILFSIWKFNYIYIIFLFCFGDFLVVDFGDFVIFDCIDSLLVLLFLLLFVVIICSFV